MSNGTRKTQAERNLTTRKLLVDTGRKHFVSFGYVATTMPEVVAEAGVTRGALYHHFASKHDLFRGVIDAEAAEVARRIIEATPAELSARDSLREGATAFLDAMSVAGRTRLLLVDAPSVLGVAEMQQIDSENAGGTLTQGLLDACAEVGTELSVDAAVLSEILSAALDRAAIAIDGGADETAVRETVVFLLDRVTASAS